MNELERRITALEARLDRFNSYTTIPLEVDNAFRRRFEDSIGLTLSDKAADSEDVVVVASVDFAGQTTTTANVLADPEEWLKISLGGIPYYIPSFT